MRQDEFYLLQQEFFKKLDTKTGWGKEHVKLVFNAVVAETNLLEPNTDSRIHLIKELEALEKSIQDLREKFNKESFDD